MAYPAEMQRLQQEVGYCPSGEGVGLYMGLGIQGLGIWWFSFGFKVGVLGFMVEVEDLGFLNRGFGIEGCG